MQPPQRENTPIPPEDGDDGPPFGAENSNDERAVRGPQERTNPAHRPGVERDEHALLIHLSDEDGAGWTTIAVDQATRHYAVAQAPRQAEALKKYKNGMYRQEAP